MRSRRERWEGESGASFGVAGGGGFLGAGFLGGSFFAGGAGIVFERGGGFWSWRERRSGR